MASLSLSTSIFLMQLSSLITTTTIDTPMKINVKYKQVEGEILEDPTLYRRLVGSLIYLTIKQLDISFFVHTVNKFMQSPRHFHLSVMHRIIRYLLGTSTYGLFFPTNSSLQLCLYNDANWASCPSTRKSTTSWCMFLGNALISWKCKKQDSVPKSSTEAKYCVMFVACSEIIRLHGVLSKLGFTQAQPIPLHVDNTSVIQTTKNPMNKQSI